VTGSPRVSSISSSVSSNNGSQSSFTTAPSSSGPKTPGTLSPPPAGNILASGASPHQTVGSYDSYSAMNSTGTEMYYQQHMSAGQAPPPQTVTSGGMQHYAHPAQPPLLQPGPAQYPTQGAYPQYSYTNGLTSPPTGPPAVSNSMGGQNVLPLPGVAPPPSNMQNQYQGFDTTGQIAPPGMKPRVTATLWEDEGSLCFQVEARGICVARREGESTAVTLVTYLPWELFAENMLQTTT
jgi:enhanced filamentous growth protein 1